MIFEGVEVLFFEFEELGVLKVCIMDYGGVIVGFEMFDRNGELVDVVQGFDLFDGYFDVENFYIGVIVGCYVNCIVGGYFEFGG